MFMGLLEKAQQRKEALQETKDLEEKSLLKEVVEEPKPKKVVYSGIKVKKEGQRDVVDERKDFGWKGLGSRRIVFDPNINEYRYEVSEPVLKEEELKTKNELTRLFKMLADVNVFDIDKEEKKKHLEETLERIIIDNDVKFGVKDLDKTSKDSVKDFLHIKSISKKENAKPGTDENKPDKKTSSSQKMEEETKRKKTKTDVEEKKKELEEEKKAKDKIFYHIFREFIGYGKIDILMGDEGIEDISCDGHHVPIFIYHKKYEAISTNIRFEDADELDSFVVRLSQICGKQISIYSPIVDGKLPDGSRLQTTLAKTVTKGSTFTIRKFRADPFTPIDLIGYNTLSVDMAAYFWMVIENGASILFCGGTASGKTSSLNALSLFIPASHKIVSIEDTREVSLPHDNWIAGTTREGFASSEENKTGKDIDMFDLIRAAMRQRPRVIIVGEVRGKEAYNLFQAMATGHTSYATVHASTIHTLIQRLENPPISLPRALLTSLDVIVFQNAVDIGGKAIRRITSVTEVVKLDPDTNQLIFMEPFSWVSKTDDRFESSGTSKILNNIRLQNDWTEEQLNKELENRMLILEWMKKKNIRSYKEVGRIVSDYHKYPDVLLKKAKGEMKQ
jgi:flagellar protein FlaI